MGTLRRPKKHGPCQATIGARKALRPRGLESPPVRFAARVVGLCAAALAIAIAVRRALEKPSPLPPPAANERDTVVGGVRWRSREKPGAGGEPVVFVHGFLSSSSTWDAVLSSAGSRPAIALDLPGTGFSDRPWPHDYTVGGAAADLLAYLEARRLGPAVLVGNSLGGAVCMVAAAARPDRVRALVLVDSASPQTRIPPGFILLRTPLVGELQLELLTRPVMEYTLRHRLYARADRVTEKTIDAWWRPITVPGTRRAALAAIRTTRRGYEGLARRIGVPTLVLWGREDRLLPASEGLELAKAIADARLVVIPDAGHLPQEEQPEEFRRALAGFLAGL
jgi:pimeloyl-ACP methyl ester carboxylesterase